MTAPVQPTQPTAISGLDEADALDGTELVPAVQGGINVRTTVADIAGVPTIQVMAFADLPATPAEGMLRGVTDSNTLTWGATIAGGGANHVLAYYNGTNWTVAGK